MPLGNAEIGATKASPAAFTVRKGLRKTVRAPMGDGSLFRSGDFCVPQRHEPERNSGPSRAPPAAL
jgi:hypothetical protein